jgi:hypothetical protein
LKYDSEAQALKKKTWETMDAAEIRFPLLVIGITRQNQQQNTDMINKS